MRFVELSHIIEDGLITYPGLPAPLISDHLSREESGSRYAPGTTFQIGRIEMVANTGTYVDSPFHRFAEGADLAGLELRQMAFLDGLVVDVPEDVRGIGIERLAALPVEGRAVLFHTGWSRHFATLRYGSGHPYLTSDAAKTLVDRKAALVGIDSLNIDDTSDASRPAHTLLLRAGIPIVEHLTNLNALKSSTFRFFAIPPRIKGFGSFPVRAFAAVEEGR